MFIKYKKLYIKNLRGVVDDSVAYVLGNVCVACIVAAGSGVTLVPSCDGERGEPARHRWCQGRDPQVSRPSRRLRSQTGSKRSKGGAETLHTRLTKKCTRKYTRVVRPISAEMQNWLQ